MRRITLLFLFLFAFVCGATDVKYLLRDPGSNVLSNRKCLITPVNLTNASGGIINIDPRMFSSDANGIFYYSNQIAGVYQGDVQAPPARFTFRLYVPDTNILINAWEWLVADTNKGVPAETASWSISTADGRFLRIPTNAGSLGQVPSWTSASSTEWKTVSSSGFVGDGNQFSGSTTVHIKDGSLQTNAIFQAGLTFANPGLTLRRSDGFPGLIASFFSGQPALSNSVTQEKIIFNDGIQLTKQASTTVTITEAASTGTVTASNVVANFGTINGNFSGVGSNWLGTNFNLATPKWDMYVTNSSVSNMVLQLTPPLGHQLSSEPFTIRVGDGTNVDALLAVVVNPFHNGLSQPSAANTEIQITTGGNFAMVPSFQNSRNGHIQWGARGLAKTWHYHYYQLPTITANALDYSEPEVYACAAYDGSANALFTAFPGLIARATSAALGMYELDVFSNLRSVSFNPGSNGEWDGDTTLIDHGLQVYGTTNGIYRGVNLRGALLQERAVSSSSASTIALDFGSAACRDITVSAASVTFFTTNWFAYSTNVEPKLFVIRGAATTTLTFPIGATGWNTNFSASMPLTISAGQMILLKLIALGLGETNVAVESIQMLNDNSFAWDADAIAFFTRASITDPVQKAAVNTLVTGLKNNGTPSFWACCDAIYPFVGGNSTSHSKNLKETNTRYDIAWTGSVTHDANGITTDGATGYGDTGFIASSASSPNYALDSAHLFVYQGTTPASGSFMAGAARMALDRNGSSLGGRGPNNNDNNVLNVDGSNDMRGPGLFQRTSSSAVQAGIRALWTAGSSTSGTVPSDSFIALGINNGGAFVNGAVNLRGMSFGKKLGAGTQGEWDTYRGLWETFNTTLGRNVP